MQQPISVTVRPRKKKRFDSARVPNYSSLIPQKRTVKGMSSPKIFFSNVRSMVNKVDDIFASVSVNLWYIVVIVESWLTSSVTDDLISMPGYVMCRRDRPNNHRGGGLCTFINSRLNFVELRDLSEPEIESLWFLIRMDRLSRGVNSIILGTLYHPPQSDDRALRSHIFKCLDSSLAVHPNSAIVVLGDFNQFQPANLCSSFKLKVPMKRSFDTWVLSLFYYLLIHWMAWCSLFLPCDTRKCFFFISNMLILRWMFPCKPRGQHVLWHHTL